MLHPASLRTTTANTSTLCQYRRQSTLTLSMDSVPGFTSDPGRVGQGEMSLGARDCTRADVGSAGVAEQLADDVGRLLIGALGPVRVDLHGGGAIGVAQPRGHCRNGYAGVEELCGLEVAEVVQPN